MKDKKWFFVAAIVLTVAVVFGTASIAHAQSVAVVRWEYRVIEWTQATQANLNQLGAEGWELITFGMVPLRGGADGYILRRRLP